MKSLIAVIESTVFDSLARCAARGAERRAEGRTLVAASILMVLAACAPGDPKGAEGGHDPIDPIGLDGEWRGVLSSPGGELPFTLRIDEQAGEGPRAWISNGEELAPISMVERDADTVVFRFAGYDSEITATISTHRHGDRSDHLLGHWRRTSPESDSVLPFEASRGVSGRFTADPRIDPRERPASADFGGTWTAVFEDEDGEFPARGVFEQTGSWVTGTFRTTTGDYRYLAGEVIEAPAGAGSGGEGLPSLGAVLRLSTFDGAHAFLFDARFSEPGRLVGNFWSRDRYHATWTARKVIEGDELPSPFAQVGLTNEKGRFSFSFPDLDGNLVSSGDPRFVDKVLLVEIFGSWCPNCNDSAPLVASWYERYRDRGFEVVGLAYEITGVFERDAEFVRRYRDRHQLAYPLLVAGTSDKSEASATLPDLTAVLSFPTKILIGRDGTVQEIYSGFDGPSTGTSHDEMVAALETRIEQLLASTRADLTPP